MKWVLIFLAILFVLPISACGASEQDLGDAYQQGFDSGYKTGQQVGYHKGFYDGAHEGYSEGLLYYKIERPLGIEPNMDWLFSRYPQYR